MTALPIPADLLDRAKQRFADFDAITIETGGHGTTKDAFCVMELSAYIAGEPWSDAPQCVSPAISAFLRSWNDSVDDDFRQRLKPYALLAIGTRTTDADETTRAWMATDWLVRQFAPAWLDVAGLTERAAELRALQPLTSDEIAIAVQGVIERASSDARAARSAAESAAWSAARSAAWSAAGSAARSAARSAAWSAAESAARSAAWSAAWSAARSAATEKLTPTVNALQTSAFALLDAMIAVGRAELCTPTPRTSAE